jgi:hypothetical protein
MTPLGTNETEMTRQRSASIRGSALPRDYPKIAYDAARN